MSVMTPARQPGTRQQAAVAAALAVLERMGLSPADLVAAPASQPTVPTFAEYVPVVSAAVSAGTRRAYGSYWNRITEHWGDRRLDEPTPSEIRQLMTWVKTLRGQIPGPSHRLPSRARLVSRVHRGRARRHLRRPGGRSRIHTRSGCRTYGRRRTRTGRKPSAIGQRASGRPVAGSSRLLPGSPDHCPASSRPSRPECDQPG